MMNYPWKTISPKDTITALKFTILSDLHMNSIISLYQPLIGKEASSLYLVLKEYLEQTVKREIMLSDILVQLNCGVKEYYQARIKLEAYGLIRVFKHNSVESSYALALEAPMIPQQFFADSMMKMMLMEKVGERIVKELEERFQVHSHDLKEYSEVTKSFLDVIHIDMKKMSETIETQESETEKNRTLTDQAMNSEQFDWSFFVEGLNKHYINNSSLTSNIKKLIYTFHVIYDINELEMQKFVLEAADISSGRVDENKLTSLIQKRYLNQSKRTETVSDASEDKTYQVNQLKQKGLSSEEIEIILHAQEMNPYAYLKSIKQQKGGFVTSNETWLLKELVENAPLSTPVINILLNYLLIIKDAPTLEKGLATKIANDWAQSQVKSPEEAMQKVKQLYASFKEKQKPQSQPRQTYGKSRNKSAHARNETLPDWATKTPEKDKPLSKEKEEDLKTRLERIRSKRRDQS